ncbi:hypothetical protein CAL18_12375 [Bordetella genomosp. 7]|uniref:hypothetical protein n=1 Tax=Bordetella genomosp. 7 TaxID=1416805 RepID=UPI000B9EDF92|nr:hypothetical protein [Bordetella genomosp. 7]OZI21716.1 hypothetical protein CAL18_12375 [Bordetella genomosp. 7]
MNEETVGRELQTVVEVEQDFCQHRYGVAPCAAAIGVTGQRKCFNTLATCQDPENYSPQPLVLHFCKPGERLPDVYCIPSVQSVSTAPTEINPGGGNKNSGPLGKRASIRVSFKDHPHSDNVVDPYVSERDYNPTERGTFWSKWLARNPYYNNRVLRVREGYAGQALEDMVTRTYLIDKIDGPDSRGKVQITAKDVLKLADNDKAQAPRPSAGELLVGYGEDDSISFLRVTRALASEYPAPGTVRVNDELMRYTGVSTISETEIRLTGITRATDGSARDSHEAGDRVQICLRYTNKRVDDLAYEWLTQYGEVPAAWIDFPEWQEETSLWLQQFELTGLITEPTGVTDLLSEITEQCLFFIWWDERAQKVKLQAIKPPIFQAVPKINDYANIIADSAELSQDPKARVSQVWVFWGQRDPTENLDKEANYRKVRIRADLEAEGSQQYGEQRIRKIYSRWLQSDAQAVNVTARLLSRYRNNPRYATISVDAKDRAMWTGDVVDMLHRGVVDETGAPLETRYQILSAEETVPGHSVEYRLEVYEYSISFRIGLWMDDDAPDFADATEVERATGAWWADNDGQVDGSPGYNWT